MPSKGIGGGRVLGQLPPQMPEVIIYPLAQVDIKPGSCNIGNATHYLKITLPANGKEIRIPYNRQALLSLAQEASRAADTGEPQQQQEGSNL